jgi:hypothetical protein
MGGMSLRACKDLGIKVFMISGQATVKEAVNMHLNNELDPLTMESVINPMTEGGCDKKK